jgi:hypothetical protein
VDEAIEATEKDNLSFKDVLPKVILAAALLTDLINLTGLIELISNINFDDVKTHNAYMPSHVFEFFWVGNNYIFSYRYFNSPVSIQSFPNSRILNHKN